jgi:hypothetical protein
MLEKFKNCDFGRCPRVYCNGQACLPVGLSGVACSTLYAASRRCDLHLQAVWAPVHTELVSVCECGCCRLLPFHPHSVLPRFPQTSHGSLP